MEINKFNEFVNNDNLVIEKLIDDLENQKGNCSVLEKIYSHPSYIKIIEYGEKSIPLLLNRIGESMFWFEALRRITGDEPDKESIKSIDIMNSWKKWGIENGYK